MKTIISTFGLIFFMVFHLSAEPETGNTTDGNEIKGPVFRTTSLGEWTGPQLFVQKGKNWESVEMLDMGLSAPIRFLRGEPLVFSRKTVVEGAEQYIPVVKVSIPETCQSPLILMRVQPDKSIKQYVSDMDPKNFPYGSYKLVNFTPKTVIAQFGKKRFSLAMGGTELIDPRQEAENRLPVMIVLSQGEKKPVVLYSNMVMNRPGKRMMMFLHLVENKDGAATAQVRSLVDFRQ